MAALTTIIVFLFICSTTAEFWSRKHTDFHLDLEISCSLTINWCFRVLLVEWDQFTNDLIFHAGIIHSNRFSERIRIKGEQWGDGPLSNFYDLELHITHNCTPDGSIRFYKKKFHSIPVTEKIYNTSISLDLTGKGERVDDFTLR